MIYRPFGAKKCQLLLYLDKLVKKQTFNQLEDGKCRQKSVYPTGEIQ